MSTRTIDFVKGDVQNQAYMLLTASTSQTTMREGKESCGNSLYSRADGLAMKQEQAN
jgi:hypothetical protein